MKIIKKKALKNRKDCLGRDKALNNNWLRLLAY